MFIHLDRASHIPIYRQIQESIGKLIGQGVLQPGERLPSTRQLGMELGINRMTVEAAFSQLEADGLITAQVGRGTFVNSAATALVTNSRSDEKETESLLNLWGPLFADYRPVPMSLPTMQSRNGSDIVSFVSAAPGPDLFPAIDFRRCANFVLKRRVSDISRMGSSDGLGSLKRYLVRWFSQNGIAATEDEILITTGCQQSMDLIRKVLIRPGDSLVLENPTYPGAVAALAPSSSERLELPVHGQEVDIRGLKALLDRNRCKVIYVVPNFHNPTGRAMSTESRTQLAYLAHQYRVPIVEDDVFGELRYSARVLPALRSLVPEMAIYMSSFSKMLNPSLRLGWILAPRPVIRQLNMVKQSSDLHTSLFVQATLDEFCRRDLLNRHLKRVRRIFQKRRDAMAEAIHRYFPSDARFQLPDGGLSIWVSLPRNYMTEDLLRLASERGVQFLPGSAFYFRSPLSNSLRLSFSSEPEDRIERGIRILGSLLHSERSSLAARPDHADLQAIV